MENAGDLAHVFSRAEAQTGGCMHIALMRRAAGDCVASSNKRTRLLGLRALSGDLPVKENSPPAAAR